MSRSVHSSTSALLLLFLSLLLLHHSSQDPQIGLRVSPDQKSVRSPARQQFVVTCEGFGAEPNLFSNVRWLDPRGQHVDDYYTRQVNPDIRAEELGLGRVLLHFVNPSADNSGEYRCLATFQHSDSFEARVQLTFFQDVQWEDCPSLQSLILGQTHERVRCKASANPKPNIQWTKDNEPLDVKRYQMDSDGVLINDEIKEQDGGVYRVRALVTETGRLHDTYVTVQVLRKPEVEDLPRIEAVEGLEASITCVTRGRPEPLVTWLDPHQRNLSSVGGYSVDRSSGNLVISRARLVEDSGRFTCVAENAAGSDRKWTEVTVIRAPKVSSFSNQSFDENKESFLECRATGDPIPALSIRRDGDSRPLATGDPRVTLEALREREESVLRLKLNPTTRADDGLYFCRSENRGGVAEAVGHLEVRFAPDMRRTPSNSVKHWDLNPLNITCIADAIPNATIRWFFRGLELIPLSVRGMTIEDSGQGVSRLHIDVRNAQRDVYGLYRCHAFNSLGANEVRIQVDQAFRPGAVLQTSADRISAQSISFRVLAPSFDGGMPLKAMHSQFRSEDSPEWQMRKWPVDARQDSLYLLDGLRPRTRYLFRFAAENEIGIGDWSVERAVWTEREKRPERPLFRNLPLDPQTREVVSPFGDQFQVTWTLPEDNGRPIRYFELSLRLVRKSEFGFDDQSGESPRLHSVSMTDQSMTSFTIRDLKPNHYYRLELRANNELGFSDVSEVVFRTSSKTTNDDIDDSDDTSLSAAGPSLALIAGLALAAIVVLLLVTDLFFFFRYKVGAIYFLSRYAFVSSGNSTTMTTKTTSDDRSRQRRRDDQNEPFFGRASAV